MHWCRRGGLTSHPTRRRREQIISGIYYYSVAITIEMRKLLRTILPFLSIALQFTYTFPFNIERRQVTDAPNSTQNDLDIVDPVAIQADSIPWYQLDPFQQDHIRFHCYLSMAAYGDYKNLCPSTFAVQGNEFEILQEFETNLGQKGFVARVPLMQKVVIVFKGYDSYTPLSWDPVQIDIGRPLAGCGQNCTAGRGVLDLYNSARLATDNWSLAKSAVNATGLKFSVTGHGIGGSVAQLAALDLGSGGWVHYAHSQAAPRSMSPAAAQILGKMFQGESGQHVIANNDFFPHIIPRSESFTRVSTAVWIFGNQTEWMRSCNYYPENKACLGNGTSIPDNYYYFTPMGQCGAANKGF
ncbi:hypothetical protein O181_076848 [Austropuccinia psidii MF-1]|uniref:Fungal lipase-type domain-containing protein n=1 Tax=Austropuccinia psidii MF-1 TaxID=1389203 RepID=A0A9Q3FFV9_9BASI|nr:hypothetical protein [Austropuccinia psidii MF-1]